MRLGARTALLAAAAWCGLAGCALPDRSPADASPPAAPVPGTSPTGISPEEASRVLPLAPRELQVALEAGFARLTWAPTGEDVASYVCLRRPVAAADWTAIAAVSAGSVRAASYSYDDHDVRAGDTYVYGVQAVGSRGGRSAITSSGPVSIG